MKFAAKTAEKVAWTTDQHMACCNLPPAMMQHWTYVYELNGYLMELVRYSSIGYRVANFPLNPLAPEHVPQSMKNNQEGHNARNIQVNSTSSEQWKIPRQYARKHGRSLSDAVDRNVSPCEILSVKEEEDNAEETHMQKRNQEIKSKKEPSTTMNSCDIDEITVEEIKTFIEKVTDGETNGGGNIVECEKCSMHEDDAGAVIEECTGLESAHDSLAHEMDEKDAASQYCELNAYLHQEEYFHAGRLNAELFINLCTKYLNACKAFDIASKAMSNKKSVKVPTATHLTLDAMKKWLWYDQEMQWIKLIAFQHEGIRLGCFESDLFLS